MPHRLHIAAIDAGSNAIRLVVARVDEAGRVEILERKRSAVRLGHGVFTRHAFDDDTIAHAVQAFINFRRTMDRLHVTQYRAVATSATRNAHNRRELLDRVLARAGIELEVIDGDEEARLVRTAVIQTLAPRVLPRLIFDLGGGSLEINLMQGFVLEDSRSLPVGTVRLLESPRPGRETMTRNDVRRVKRRVEDVLRGGFDAPKAGIDGIAVACGGNAETLGLIAPGKPLFGVHSLDLNGLRSALPALAAMDVATRQKTYEVRRDRAEVMVIAAIVLCTLGAWLNVDQLLTPGVGGARRASRGNVCARVSAPRPFPPIAPRRRRTLVRLPRNAHRTARTGRIQPRLSMSGRQARTRALPRRLAAYMATSASRQSVSKSPPVTGSLGHARTEGQRATFLRGRRPCRNAAACGR